MACNFTVCSRPTQRLTFVIVNLSLTAVHRKVIQKVIPEVFMHLQPGNFRRETFRKVSVVTKIIKMFNYENLALYDMSFKKSKIFHGLS